MLGSKRLSLRMPEAMHISLEGEAKVLGVSVSDVIRISINEHFNKKER